MDTLPLLSILMTGLVIGSLVTLWVLGRRDTTRTVKERPGNVVDREIQRQAAMLALVLDTIPVRVFWKDREGHYLGCNQLFAFDSGHQSSRDLLGKTDFDMPWREDAEEYRAEDQEVLSTGRARLLMNWPSLS